MKTEISGSQLYAVRSFKKKGRLNSATLKLTAFWIFGSDGRPLQGRSEGDSQ